MANVLDVIRENQQSVLEDWLTGISRERAGVT